MLEIHLTVLVPFGAYVRGDRIADQKKVAAILNSHPNCVVPILAPYANTQGA